MWTWTDADILQNSATKRCTRSAKSSGCKQIAARADESCSPLAFCLLFVANANGGSAFTAEAEPPSWLPPPPTCVQFVRPTFPSIFEEQAHAYEAPACTTLFHLSGGTSPTTLTNHHVRQRFNIDLKQQNTI